MAPISKVDSEGDIDEKLKIVNMFIDSYVNIRTMCHKTITQSSIRDDVFDMIKEVRECNKSTLRDIIGNKM